MQGDSRQGDRNGRGHVSQWWSGVQRVYLDATVFEHDDALQGLADEVMPHLSGLVQEQHPLRLVLPASARATVGSRAAQGLPAARRLLDHLNALPVDTLTPSGSGASVASLIVADCLENRHRFRQAVFTQDRDLATQVQAGAQGGSDRSAKGVAARCVLRAGSMSWRGYEERCRKQARLDPPRLAAFSRVLVDTCSLMFAGIHPGQDGQPVDAPLLGLAWLEQALPALERAGGRLVVVQEVINELDDKSASHHPGERRAAQAARQWLEQSQTAGLVMHVPELKDKRHGDPAITSWFVRNGYGGDVCVLTQDRKLARELLAHLPGPPRFSRVCRIDQRGARLIDWRWEQDDPDNGPRVASGVDAPGGSAGSNDPPTAQDDTSAARPSNGMAQPPGPKMMSERTEPRAIAPQAGSPAANRAAEQPASRAAPPAASPAASPATPSVTAREAPHPSPSPASPAVASAPPPPIATPVTPSRRRWLVGATVAALAVGVGLNLMAPAKAPTMDLLVDGRPVPLDGQRTATLPPGTRFTVQARVDVPGMLELIAYNASLPKVPVLLVQMRAEPGRTVMSPVLRVDPGPGTDRLELVHRPDNGQPRTQNVYVRHR